MEKTKSAIKHMLNVMLESDKQAIRQHAFFAVMDLFEIVRKNIAQTNIITKEKLTTPIFLYILN